MILLGLLPVVTVSTAVITSVGKYICKDEKREIENVKNKSQRIIDEANDYVNKINRKFKKACKSLNAQRKEINNSTLKKASEISQKIRWRGSKNYYEHFNAAVSELDCSVDASKRIGTTVLSNISILAGPVGVVTECVMLSCELDEAKAEQEEIRAHSEKLKLDCSKIEHYTRILRDTQGVISSLNKLTLKSLENVERIFEEKGYNISDWEDNDIESIRLMFNFVKALSDIINTRVFTQKGEISRKYKKLIGYSKELLD